MNDFLSIHFWLAAMFIYLAMHIRIPRISRTLWFGLSNLVAVGILAGWRITVWLLGVSAVFWLHAQLVQHWKSRKRVRATAIMISVGFIVPLVLFILNKYRIEDPTLLEHVLNLAPDKSTGLLKLLAVFAFSYMMLRIFDAAKSTWIDGKPLLDPISLSGYILPFHMVISGPIASYADHLAMNNSNMPSPTFSRLLQGVNIITTGFLYKYVIGESLRIFAFGYGGAIHTGTILTSAYLIIYIFFDFCGYSRIAYGIGLLCNVPTPDNFRAPFLSKSITEFWTRWHISLGDFIRRNLFLPLQMHFVRRFGLKKAKIVVFVSLVLSFGATGVWHRLSFTLLLWGLVMGMMLGMEKTVQTKLATVSFLKTPWGKRIVSAIAPIYVFSMVTLAAHLIFSELLNP